ncbi:hypothetical protein PC120_g19247 [Phytophthora cactorum]|nr:hypothetical protein PC120_g19247 [Phytophthora cactorum]
MSLSGFRFKKLLEFNSDKLVYSIDREEKDIYGKMKQNIAGGPSIIFNRYAKRNQTKIRGGKLVKKSSATTPMLYTSGLLVLTCLADAWKGLFPYEYIKAFEVLNETNIPLKSAFDSALRGTSITNADYERVKFVWKHYEMKSIKDLLIWYNNLDVVPFIKAIEAQRELFKRFDLDMFADGVSLPGLSEKVMYQTCFNELQHPKKVPAKAFRFTAKRMSGYKHQDVVAKREFNMTLDHLNTLLKKQKNICVVYASVSCYPAAGYT